MIFYFYNVIKAMAIRQMTNPSPESAESSNTWNWLERRVASPPLKSPLPHTTAEVKAIMIPMRLGEKSIDLFSVN
jgi:hypothetical protein